VEIEPIKERHVRPNAKGGWDVSGRDEGHVASRHEAGSKAKAWARSLLLQNGGGTLKIYSRKGALIREDEVN
jgi:hypothetical protein